MHLQLRLGVFCCELHLQRFAGHYKWATSDILDLGKVMEVGSLPKDVAAIDRCHRWLQ